MCIAWWGSKVRMEKFAKWWHHTLELYCYCYNYCCCCYCYCYCYNDDYDYNSTNPSFSCVSSKVPENLSVYFKDWLAATVSRSQPDYKEEFPNDGNRLLPNLLVWNTTLRKYFGFDSAPSNIIGPEWFHECPIALSWDFMVKIKFLRLPREQSGSPPEALRILIFM